MSSPLLEVKDLQVAVGEEQKILLNGLNLTVCPGETHVLMGHNGAGKSTLIKILMGEEGPDEGKIRMGPTVKIGYLPQIIHFDHPERSLVDTMLLSLIHISEPTRP